LELEIGVNMKILPDGTVEIRNKRTGETKIVNPEDLPSYGIDYSAYETQLKSFKNVGGETTAKVTEKADEKTEGERVKAGLANSGLTSLKKVQDFIEKDSSLPNKQLIPGKLASRSFDSALFGAVDALLRIRTGATAPEEEIRRYMDAYGPKAGDTADDINFKMQQLKTALASEGGIDEERVNKIFPSKQAESPSLLPGYEKSIVPGSQPTSSPAIQRAQQNARQVKQQNLNPLEQLLAPVAQGPIGAGAEGLLGLLAPGVKKVAQTAGRGETVPLSQGVEAGGDLLAAAIPALKIGKLGLAAKGALSGATSGVTQEGSMGDRLKSGGLQALLGGALGGAAQIPGVIKKNFSLKSIGAQRDAAVSAAKDVKFPGNEIAEAAKAYVEDDPMAKNVLNKILPSIENKDLTLPQLMKKIDVWNDAYTTAGRVGKSAEAGLNNVLAQTAKKLVNKSAPAVTEANKKFSKAYGVRQTARRVLPFAAGGIGLGAGGNILADLLLGRGNQ
jgi:hypothetical protein